MAPLPRRGKHVPGWCRPHRTGLPMDHPCNPAYYDRKDPKPRRRSEHGSEVICRSEQEDQIEDSVAQVPEVQPPDEVPSHSLGAFNGRDTYTALSEDRFSKLYYPNEEEPYVEQMAAPNACDKINAQLDMIEGSCLPPRMVPASNLKPLDPDAELFERDVDLYAFLQDICKGKNPLSRAKRLDTTPVLDEVNDKRHIETLEVEHREFLAPLKAIGGVLGDEIVDELEDTDEDEEATADTVRTSTESPQHVCDNVMDGEESDHSFTGFFSDVQDTVTDDVKKALEKRNGKDKDELDTPEWVVNDLVARQNQHKWMEALRDREIATEPLVARQNQHKWMEALRGRDKLDTSTWVVNDLVARADDAVKHRGLKAFLKPLGAFLGGSQSDDNVVEKEASQHPLEDWALRLPKGDRKADDIKTCPMGVELRWAPAAWAAVIGGIILLGSMAGMFVCWLIGRRRPSKRVRGVHGFERNLAESKEHPLPNNLGQSLETPGSLAVEPGVSDSLAPGECVDQTTEKKVSFDVPESEEEGPVHGKPIVKDFEGSEPWLKTSP